jgi:hypothetical protein
VRRSAGGASMTEDGTTLFYLVVGLAAVLGTIAWITGR